VKRRNWGWAMVMSMCQFEEFHLYAYVLMRNVEDYIQKDEELARRIALLERNLTKKGKKKYLISVA